MITTLLDRLLLCKTFTAVWHRKLQASLLLLALALYWALYRWSGKSPEHTAAWDAVDAILKLGTLLIAGVLWIEEAYRHWEDNLPKFLFVEFRLTGTPVLRAEKVPLLDAGDIRQFSQQVGAQMVGERRLKFSLDIEHWTHVEHRRPRAESRKCYVTRFTLDVKTPLLGAPPRDVCRYPATEAVKPVPSVSRPPPVDLLALAKEGKCLYLCPAASDTPIEKSASKLDPLPGENEV